LVLCIPVNAQIITGEVEYNTEYRKIDKLTYDELRTKFYDSNNIENLNYLFQGITELKDRKLVRFSDGTYSIQYYDDPLFAWYYSSNGKLISYTRKENTCYPCKFIKFKPDGSIINTGLRISKQESFIYSSEGKLLAHWLGGKCYDQNNNLVMTRKVTE
jgi:hypothetical protein